MHCVCVRMRERMYRHYQVDNRKYHVQVKLIYDQYYLIAVCHAAQMERDSE